MREMMLWLYVRTVNAQSICELLAEMDLHLA